MGSAGQDELVRRPLSEDPKGEGRERIQGCLAWVSSSPAASCPPPPNIPNHGILLAWEKEGDLDAAFPWASPAPPVLGWLGGGLAVWGSAGGRERMLRTPRVPGTRVAIETSGEGAGARW